MKTTKEQTKAEKLVNFLREINAIGITEFTTKHERTKEITTTTHLELMSGKGGKPFIVMTMIKNGELDNFDIFVPVSKHNDIDKFFADAKKYFAE